METSSDQRERPREDRRRPREVRGKSPSPLKDKDYFRAKGGAADWELKLYDKRKTEQLPPRTPNGEDGARIPKNIRWNAKKVYRRLAMPRRSFLSRFLIPGTYGYPGDQDMVCVCCLEPLRQFMHDYDHEDIELLDKLVVKTKIDKGKTLKGKYCPWHLRMYRKYMERKEYLAEEFKFLLWSRKKIREVREKAGESFDEMVKKLKGPEKGEVTEFVENHNKVAEKYGFETIYVTPSDPVELTCECGKVHKIHPDTTTGITIFHRPHMDKLTLAEEDRKELE